MYCEEIVEIKCHLMPLRHKALESICKKALEFNVNNTNENKRDTIFVEETQL